MELRLLVSVPFDIPEEIVDFFSDDEVPLGRMGMVKMVNLEELVELEMPDSEELVLLEMVCLVEQVRNGILLMGLVEVDEHDLHVQELPDDFMDEEEEQIVRQGQEHKVSSSSPILPYHLLLL